MTTRSKPVFTLAVMALFGSVFAGDMAVASSNAEHRVDRQIQACVDEIREHADYASASRIVHSVSRLNQRNAVELEIKVETVVYATDADAAVREYRVSCVTASLGDVVRFRINQSTD